MRGYPHYALFTQHHHEMAVIERLNRHIEKMQEIFLPRISVQRVQGAKWHSAIPRVVIIQCFMDEAKELALTMLQGVIRIIPNDIGAPRVIPEEEVTLLKKLCAYGTEFASTEKQRFYSREINIFTFAPHLPNGVHEARVVIGGLLDGYVGFTDSRNQRFYLRFPSLGAVVGVLAGRLTLQTLPDLVVGTG